MKNVKIVKSSGSTERDQDEGQGQGPASSRAEKMKNEEIRHTTSQTKKWLQGSHVPVSLTDVTEELEEDVEAQQQGRQDRDPAELKLLQFPKPLSGRRSDTNSNKTSTTKTASSTLPQHQILRYLNIKFYATSTKTQDAGGEEEDTSESRHGWFLHNCKTEEVRP